MFSLILFSVLSQPLATESDDLRSALVEMTSRHDLVVGTPAGREAFHFEVFWSKPAWETPKVHIREPYLSWTDRFYVQDSYMQIGNEKVDLKCASILGQGRTDRQVIHVNLYPDESLCHPDGPAIDYSPRHRLSFVLNGDNVVGTKFRYLYNEFSAVSDD